ncbi:unnamed protein product, partial [Ectocarpus fasciculatus]
LLLVVPPIPPDAVKQSYRLFPEPALPGHSDGGAVAGGGVPDALSGHLVEQTEGFGPVCPLGARRGRRRWTPNGGRRSPSGGSATSRGASNSGATTSGSGISSSGII